MSKTVSAGGEDFMKYYDYLTDFIFVSDTLERADAIFIPGGLYGEIAVHAASLYLTGAAPLVIPSGKYSIVLGGFGEVKSPDNYKGRRFDTESDFLTQILMDEGVPAEAILQERKAAYTYQNAIFTKKLLDEKKIPVKTAILSCQAYHARRCLMYYQLMFPETKFCVSPVVTRGISRENWYTRPESIRLVLSEVEHCGSQFVDIMCSQAQ